MNCRAILLVAETSADIWLDDAHRRRGNAMACAVHLLTMCGIQVEEMI